jgi:hypothetical protein
MFRYSIYQNLGNACRNSFLGLYTLFGEVNANRQKSEFIVANFRRIFAAKFLPIRDTFVYKRNTLFILFPSMAWTYYLFKEQIVQDKIKE